MATQEGLFDIKALALEVVKQLTNTFGDGYDEKSEETASVVASLQDIIGSRLKEYNKKYLDTLALYEKVVNDSTSTKVSYNNQIKNLETEINKQKQKNKEDVESATAIFKQQRDEVTKIADKERGEMEIERAQLAQRKREAKAEIEKYKKEAQEAVEDRTETVKLWEEEKEKSKQLKETIGSLERAQKNLEYEAKNWEAEANRTGALKQQIESERDKALAESEPTRQKNRELTRELSQLKPQLKSAKRTITEQEKKIRKLEEELKITNEQLDNYKARSRGSTPKNDPAGTAAADDLANTGGLDSRSSSAASGSGASRSTELERERDKNQQLQAENEQLQATMETKYIQREVHDEILRGRMKEVSDLKVERDGLQNDSANCQTALKKLQDEVSKKDSAKIKELKAKIKDLEKQIKAFEEGANKCKDDLAKQRDRVQDLEKQLKAAKDRIAHLEEVNRAHRADIVALRADTHRADIMALRADNRKLEVNLEREKKEHQETRERFKELQDNVDEPYRQLADSEAQRTALEIECRATERALEQRNEAQDVLTQELHEAKKDCARRQTTVERMLEPNIDRSSLQDLSEPVLDLVVLRQKAFNIQEKLIPLALNAATAYETVTGKKFVIHGHDITEGNRPYISRPDEFINDIRDFYNRLTDRIGEAQNEIDKLKKNPNAVADNAAAQKTIDSMKKQIDTLEKKTKDLEKKLEASQEKIAKYENPGANQSQPIKAIRKLITEFLTIAGPSPRDLDNLLANLVRLQKTVPGAVPFGKETEQKAQQLEGTQKQLDECKTDRTRLQDRNRVIKSNLDDLQNAQRDWNRESKRLQAEVKRLTAELKALRGSQSTQDDDKARRDLEEAFGRITADLDTLRNEGDQERSRHADEITDLSNQLQVVRAQMEKERSDFAAESLGNLKIIKDLRDGRDGEAAKLGRDVGRLTEELRVAGDSCERERKRLEGEVDRLGKEVIDLRNNGEQERARHAAEVARLNGELQTLRNTLGEQNNVIGNNGQQAERTQVALGEQIAVLGAAQLALMRSIENMRLQAVRQGRSAAETQRSMRRAREETEMLQNLVHELTVQRDLLQDEVRLCEEAERRGRERLRANAAAAAVVAAAPGAGSGAGAGNAGARGGLAAGTGNFIARTYNLFLSTIQHGTVWGTLGSVFVMMLMVIIAEGRQYAEWQDANAHSRALWMTMKDRPTVCVGPPNMDYFWHTLVVALSGRWAFRW
ncbi:hypothetical protein F4801DRAFT_596722 [Xylaria longipes]|nr:hypothetical protein F4801DRAFT_596722 [Xylaria longipes]